MQRFKPASDYETLRIQASALYTAANALEAQNRALREQVKSLQNELRLVSRLEIEAERTTNEKLTNLLEPTDD